MAPPGYDRYGRRLPPGREPGQQVLSAAQIAKIEAAFEELQKKAAHWEQQAKQWQATAGESQSLAGEWKERASELERALVEARARAAEAQQNCDQWRDSASSAEEQFSAWRERAAEIESEAALAEQRVSELEEALKAAQEGHSDEAQRLQEIETDFLDSKSRLERRFALQAEAQRRDVFRDLLPVLDNLDRALVQQPADGQDAQSMVQGVEMTRRSFLQMLNGYDVRPINPQGQPFDPELHEAVGSVPDPNLPPGTVVSVEQPGYLIGDELLRPARVLVTPL